MKTTKIVAGLISIFLMGTTAYLFFSHWPGLKPVVLPPPANKTVDTEIGPLHVPSEFQIEVFADDIAGARVLAMDAQGDLWVSQQKSGVVSRIDIESGKMVGKEIVFRGLNNPHGIAIDWQNPGDLYIAEEHRISKACITCADKTLQKIADLPSGGRHVTRTIGFGPDDRLYVSIGSTCDVCDEKNPEIGMISMQRGGSDRKVFARGLRNSVFFRWNPVDGKMWATEMGRDHLGDDLPPDEVNVIEEGGDYGWPVCYGQNIHDRDFDQNVYIRDPCADKIPAQMNIPAHSAPLGLAFIPEEGWPNDYGNDLLVAYHGSWNRTVPTGYKIVRIKLDDDGTVAGIEDFLTGFLTADNRAVGRPVDILLFPGGTGFISDDKAGVIYKITTWQR